MQEQIWFLSQLEPDQPVYNIPIARRLTGPLQEEALEKSLSEIVRRHEALRTVITTVDDTPQQVVTPARPVPLPIVDLRAKPETDRQNEADRQAHAEVNRVFDLETDLPIRALLLRLADEEHLLIITVHHIAFDGWSTRHFLNELVTAYEAYRADETPTLPPLPVQYTDHAKWQRERLRDGTLDPHLNYWRDQLASPPVLDLPTDRPRPAEQSYRGARHRLFLPKSVTTALNALSRQAGVTLFITTLTALHVLLYRYTGQDDIIVGCPNASRTRTEIENLLGCFINTLPYRADLSGRPTFREAIHRVRDAAFGAFAHQEAPFAHLVQELQPDHDSSRSPLYQVLFQLLTFPSSRSSSDELTWAPFPIDTDVSLLDLTLTLTEHPDGLHGIITYNSDLFEATTIDRMARHYRQVVDALLNDPDQSIATFSLLTDKEREQTLHAWNQTHRPLPVACAHELFEAQVERTPDAVALAFEDQRLTYRELNRRANQLAHHLKERGVGPETQVAICVDRSPEMIVGLLGILKSGGAYVPLDPSHPDDRLAYVLRDTQAPILLTETALLNRLPTTEVQVVCLDGDRPTIAQNPDSNPTTEVTADTLAYVIYTSGSTGRPKGVMIEHGSLSNFLQAARREPGLDATDVVLSVTTPTFDIATANIFMPLTTGAQLVLVSEAVGTDGIRLAEALAHHGVTALNSPPPTWQLLVDAGWTGSSTFKIMTGGEALPPALAELLLDRGAELWNLYGPTETTIWSTCSRIESAEDISIGRPIANTTVYVLSENQTPAPVGVPGELYVGGAGLARGYLNQPELTAERFVPHPFSDDAAARLYRTGDRVRWRPNGTLEFLGRTDHQVKIRGVRIELGEIEAVLGRHPSVDACVAVVCERESGDRQLVAYVVPESAAEWSPSSVRKHLQEMLPGSMVPSAIVPLEALPLTNNGKIDRSSLPAPEWGRTALETNYVAPSTPTEKTLAQIWIDVLNVDRVGIHDNFFDLGGHSLLGLRIMAQIRDRLQTELPLRALFTAPTLADLALEIIQQNVDEHDELTQMLAELDALSDEDVRAQLDEQPRT